MLVSRYWLYLDEKTRFKEIDAEASLYDIVKVYKRCNLNTPPGPSQEGSKGKFPFLVGIKGWVMILDKIISHKKLEVEEQKRFQPLDEIKRKLINIGEVRNFRRAISHPGRINLIAEIKKASPSKGIIREDFNPSAIAKIYEQSGASAVSVLTDNEFFKGDLSYLKVVRSVTLALPILRKDFIIDEYQVYQSRLAGADAILLIAAVLDLPILINLLSIAKGIGLDCLVEVHTEEELEKVLNTDACIIGINNRDLNTFQTNIQTTARLMQLMPDDRIVVSESGISSKDDVKFLQKCGVQAMLIGESLMTSNDIALK
ncbi:MAG: indole-3-glycerol phosphate synthase, partial [Candidatus Poribacteria bacterium]|nr:indole-3-glycerol phosphate synthase [Candidatus Poribacteria bacterium]